MKTARLGDLDLAYDIAGDGGGPPLVAIMGFTGSQWHWRGFPERFARERRVVTFDNRGVGESSAPRGPYSIAQMATDTLALLDTLAIPEAILFGVSMGGMIAQEIALAAPGRVTKLILGCTSFGGAGAVPAAPEVIAAFGKIGNGATADDLREALAANFSPRFVVERADVVEELLERGRHHRMSALGFKGQASALATHDAASRVGAIAAPTLILTGDEDRLIPSANSAALAAAMPGARLVILPGVGHMFWVEAPDATEAAIRSFLG